MKKFFLLLIFIISGLYLSAQDYSKAVGIRGGLTSGFEYRFFTDETHSVKFLLGTNNGVRLHGIMEFHRHNLFAFTDRLTFFYGGGIHAGYENWNKKYVQDNTSWYDNRTDFVLGIDGIAGIEYTFLKTPLSVGAELKPYLDIFGRNMFHFEPFDFAFTVKYLF